MMPYLVFKLDYFVKSVDSNTPSRYYTIEKFTSDPYIKIDLGETGPLLFKLTQHGIDRGVSFTEYRPDEWISQDKMNSLRVRFYCCTPSVRTKEI